MLELVAAKPKYWFQGRTALLVEDNDLVHGLVRVIMQKVGVDIDICENGAEALEAVQNKVYDVVLMDIQMPIMDGLEATREIRKLGGKMLELPIIAMTANVDSNDVEMGRKAGMNVHVGKPINRELLYEILSNFLGSSMDNEIDDIPSTEESICILPELPGIDTEDGLQRIAGNITVYLGMLRNFRANYLDSGSEMKTYLQHGNCDQAARLAHSIKGNAGNIGAKNLHLCTAEMELACKNHSQGTALDLLPAFQETLAQVMRGLNFLPKPEASKYQEVKVFDPLIWSQKLNEYVELLDTDLGVAMDSLEVFKSFAGDMYGKEMSMLEKYLDAFELSLARQILIDIKTKSII